MSNGICGALIELFGLLYLCQDSEAVTMDRASSEMTYLCLLLRLCLLGSVMTLPSLMQAQFGLTTTSHCEYVLCIFNTFNIYL